MSKVNTVDAGKLSSHDSLVGQLDQLNSGDEIILRLEQDPTELLRLLLNGPSSHYDFAPLVQGPSTWAYHFAARQADEPRTFATYLGWDHDRLDDLLQAAMTAAGKGDWQSCRDDLDSFRLGLFRHIDAEEAILFPAFEERTGMRNTGPTEVMRLEHIEIRRGVDELLAAGVKESSDGLDRWHANLLGVLVEHNMKEEQILYPGTDHMLEEEPRDALVRQMLLA